MRPLETHKIYPHRHKASWLKILQRQHGTLLCSTIKHIFVCVCVCTYTYWEAH